MRNQPPSGEYHILDQITVKNTTYMIGYHPDRLKSYAVLRRGQDGSYRTDGVFGTEAAARRKLFQLTMGILPKLEVRQIISGQLNPAPEKFPDSDMPPGLITKIYEASLRSDNSASYHNRPSLENPH